MDMDEFEKEFKRDQEFKPLAAVETRSKTRHVPEVAFGGAQYVVGPPESTREAADSVATRVAEEIRAAMLARGLEMVAGYARARE